MWTVLWLIAIGIILLFASAILVGAPFLPTLKQQVEPALDLLDLKPGQTMLELGSGDGRMLIAAAKRGIHSVGYEVNPLLFMYSYLITRRHRKYVRVIWGDYWRVEWPPADGIFTFLLKPYMEKLNKKVIQYKPKNVKKLKLVSFAFSIDSKKPARKKEGLFLYEYQ
jgi:16S rRNA A1518/A1519 N6-dimethyltransferase RsmA/KsgA/DIM1 with predicted DNA glycosylase/AP lyase activity